MVLCVAKWSLGARDCFSAAFRCRRQRSSHNSPVRQSAMPRWIRRGPRTLAAKAHKWQRDFDVEVIERLRLCDCPGYEPCRCTARASQLVGEVEGWLRELGLLPVNVPQEECFVGGVSTSDSSAAVSSSRCPVTESREWTRSRNPLCRGACE